MFRAHKQQESRKQVLFIDASRLFKKGRNQNTLEPENVEQLYGWYKNYNDVQGVTKVATLEEIAQHEWNLSIPLYVEPVVEEETVTVEEAAFSNTLVMRQRTPCSFQSLREFLYTSPTSWLRE